MRFGPASAAGAPGHHCKSDAAHGAANGVGAGAATVAVTPYYDDDWLTVYSGDCRAVLAELADESVHCVVTSPPYWQQRDYGMAEQLGMEPTPEQYVANMVAVFREVRRVLRRDGTLWLNLGDSYASGGDNRNGKGGSGLNSNPAAD